jgi:leucyl aminopeptidase (aminopeptidase T)
MEMISRYGAPSTRLISLLKCLEYPLRHVRAGDKFVILTDDQMDPLIWQAMMAALNAKGAECAVCLYPKRAYHCADPSPMAIGAAKEADVVIAMTTTALNSGTPGLRQIRTEGGGKGKTPVWLWEEINQEILIDGGGSVTEAEVQEMCDVQRRVGAVFDKGKMIKVTSASGSNLTADISGYPNNSLADRWGALPFERDPVTGRFSVSPGTWPFGEVHVEPLPDTAEGVVVWDQTAHFPPGRWKESVSLHIKKGTVVDITGGHEAREVRRYLERYGDENSWRVGGEIAIGTNKRCLPYTGNMRSEKKRYGAMHFGIGHGADRGLIKSTLRLEGITDRVTVVVDDTVVCKDGEILV